LTLFNKNLKLGLLTENSAKEVKQQTIVVVIRINLELFGA